MGAVSLEVLLVGSEHRGVAVYEILQRQDITPYLFVRIQGVEAAWVTVGETRNFSNASSVVGVLSPSGLSFNYGVVVPFQGIGESGRCSLTLQDTGSYLRNLTKPGTYTYLSADLDHAETGSIAVDDTASFPSAGTVHVHREAISYTGKTATSFTGLTRCQFDSFDFPRTHRATVSGDPRTGTLGYVKVQSNPGKLEGRWVSLWAAALDSGGYPVADTNGETKWEIWRGIVTAFPPSPDAVTYRLQAETLERLLLVDPPNKAVSGSLVTGVWDSRASSVGLPSWGWEASPIFIQGCRGDLAIRITSGDSELLHSPYASGNGESTFRTLAGIGDYVSDLYVNRGITYRFSVQASALDKQVLRCVVTVPVDLPEYTIEIYAAASLVHGPSSLWQQLGFLGESYQSVSSEAAPGGGFQVRFVFEADTPPLQIWIRPDDPDLPVYFDGTAPEVPLFLKVGSEVVYCPEIVSEQVCNGLPVSVLRGCLRGQGGTYRQEIRSSVDAPQEGVSVSYAYCVAGADGVSESNVFRALYKTLIGTGDEGQTPGAYPTGAVSWPGLGVPSGHLSDWQEWPLYSPSILGDFGGTIEDLRRWINDSLAVEGYALVTAPGEDGVRLRLVRFGGAPDGTPTSYKIDAANGVDVSGGLATVINRISVSGNNDSKAVFHDGDSIAQLLVTQGREYNLPVSGAGGLTSLAPAAARIFALASKAELVTASVPLAPQGRLLAPGAHVTLSFPNIDLSGTWQVLESSTPIRGKGSVTVKVFKNLAWSTRRYAPTCTIASIDSMANTVTLASGEGEWFGDTPTVWVYDPAEYEDGSSCQVTSVSGDTLTLVDVTGLSEGDRVEYQGYSDSDSNTRYVFLVDDLCVWGD